jgi:uncharacterized repeat protein (TIGR01451 family)
MEKFSQPVCNTQTKTSLLSIVLLISLSFYVNAQNRNFGIVYSENIRGGAVLFGNTLMYASNSDSSVNSTKMNGNSVNGNSLYSNGDLNTTNMQFIDIDGITGDGIGTKNSSSADLFLPAGTNTIKIARLYWGGRVNTIDFDITQATNQTIKVRKGTNGPYQEIGAAQFEKTIVGPGTSTEFTCYQAYVDITTLVQQQGAGTYTVGNGAFSTGLGGDFGNFGGWGIMVVYENPALDFNSVRVYDGYQNIYSGGGQLAKTITLTGLNVPSGALSLTDARVGIIGWEGDAAYDGDYFKINDSLFTNSLNQINNPWNGTVSNDGVHVTTKNPSFTDQMGIDIDQFNVGLGYGILPNASSVTLEYGTNQDQYFVGLVTFVIKMKEPIIKLTKTVTDANNNDTAEIGEILTYKLKGKNVGAGNANAVVLTDSLPSTMTFVANSLKVNYGPGFITPEFKTDATSDDIAEYVGATKTVTYRMGNGANATSGGYLAFADSFEVEFQVTVNTPVNGVLPPIINTARLVATSDALIYYVDDATVSIKTPVTSLPVKLSSFSANLQLSKQVKIAWTTSAEINSSKFEIERSSDGINFNIVAIKAAAGNSSATINYSLIDDATAVTSAIAYYRLRQFDFDGKSSISKVVSVKLKKTIGNFTVSPNPFYNNLNINIEWNATESTVVKVFNVLGAEIISKKVNMIKGYNYLTIDELSKLKPGNYIIQFNANNEKLIKQITKQ